VTQTYVGKHKGFHFSGTEYLGVPDRCFNGSVTAL
jgi:hypothetical protein